MFAFGLLMVNRDDDELIEGSADLEIHPATARQNIDVLPIVPSHVTYPKCGRATALDSSLMGRRVAALHRGPRLGTLVSEGDSPSSLMWHA